MNDRIVDTLARDANAAVTSGTSLLGIGGAALTAVVAAPAMAAASSSGKKVAKRCKQQKNLCRTAFAEHCASLELPGVCEAFLTPCREPLARCDAGAAIKCVLAVMAS